MCYESNETSQNRFFNQKYLLKDVRTVFSGFEINGFLKGIYNQSCHSATCEIILFFLDFSDVWHALFVIVDLVWGHLEVNFSGQLPQPQLFFIFVETYTMASTSRYGVSLKQLRELMEFRGAEGVQKLNELGGVRGLIANLNSSDSNGKTPHFFFIQWKKLSIFQKF